MITLPLRPHDISMNFPVMNYVLKDSPKLEQFCQALYNTTDLAPAAQGQPLSKRAQHNTP